jgi:hypothetical protein
VERKTNTCNEAIFPVMASTTEAEGSRRYALRTKNTHNQNRLTILLQYITLLVQASIKRTLKKPTVFRI